jgi:hypothetical protein
MVGRPMKTWCVSALVPAKPDFAISIKYGQEPHVMCNM